MIQFCQQPGAIFRHQRQRLRFKLTTNPARILGLAPERGSLEPGRIADVSVFDVREERVIDVEAFYSRSRNCAFDGKRVNGAARHVVVGGEVVCRDGSPLPRLGLSGSRPGVGTAGP